MGKTINFTVGMASVLFVGTTAWAQSGKEAGLVNGGVVEKLKEVGYTTGLWPAHYGNHRALVRVESADKTVKVRLPWRRRDRDAVDKNIVVVDLQSEKVVANRVGLNRSREVADVIFEAESGKGDYAIYYLIRQRKPNPIKGANQGHFPGTVYQKYEETAEADWLKKFGTSDSLESLTEAKLVHFQSLKVSGPEKFRGFNSFYPMEVVATEEEVNALRKKYEGESFLTFIEKRDMPIKMLDDIPRRWIKSGPSAVMHGVAQPNEFFTFQVGVYALEDCQIKGLSFSDLKAQDGAVIKSGALRSINTEGVNYDGGSIQKEIDVKQARVQPLWVGIDVPEAAAPGVYEGLARVELAGAKYKEVKVRLEVKGETLKDKGDSDPFRMSRLRWLDSTIGLDDEVLAPYTAIEGEGDSYSILGRKIQLAKGGLPKSVVSYIDHTEIKDKGREVLAKPMRFVAESEGKEISLKAGEVKMVHKSSGKVQFESSLQSDSFDVAVRGTLESDGYMRYSMELKAKQNLNLSDTRIEIPYDKKVAKYLMGRLGVEDRIWKDTYGGYRPKQAEAAIEKGMMYNTVWSGDYNAGLGVWLKNEEDQWNGDNKTKMDTPTLPVWENAGNGKYTLKEVGEQALIGIHRGACDLKKGETVKFDFAVLLTPFKPVTKDHWDYRIYHAPYETEVKLAAAANAKVVNVHHANSHNPYINYPFLKDAYLKELVDAAHGEGRKVKLYYTIRELSTRAAEFWALRSLGDEVFIKDDGYTGLLKKPLSVQSSRFKPAGYTWLTEHVIRDYIMRWHSTIKKSGTPEIASVAGREVDASIATQGLSRWHNYYLEGLKYLMTDLGVDGLYLDGIGYDREIMKRVRKTMLLSGKQPMIDYHGSVQQGWMTLAPYMDSIWYGEGTRYDFGPDYWLMQVSGLPFGLTGEILKHDKHANMHRGMLYGISKRLGWRGNTQAKHLWKLWDSFGIKEAKYTGYFMENCPVKSGDEKVKVSVYQKKGKVMLAIASWHKEATDIDLQIDWKALGLDKNKVKMYAPTVTAMQQEADFNVGESIKIPGFKGLLIMIEEK